MVVYIVITTYNGIKWLEKCLESTSEYSVVIVDNNSRDNTVKYIRERYPEVNLIEQNENIGFGQANNLGIKLALNLGAEAVFLLNQDAWLEPNSLEYLINIQRQNNYFGILSPIHLNGNGDLLEKGFANYIAYKANPQLISEAIRGKELKHAYEVPFVNAAGWLISKECLLKVGGFDPIFHHYGEDVNFCQRVKFHGYKIGVVPVAFISHDREGSAIKEGPRFSERYFLNLERRSKMAWADLNLPIEKVRNQIRGKKQELKKEMRKAFTSLNFRKLNGLRREINLMEKVEKDALESRSRNTTPENENGFYFN